MPSLQALLSTFGTFLRRIQEATVGEVYIDMTEVRFSTVAGSMVQRHERRLLTAAVLAQVTANLVATTPIALFEQAAKEKLSDELEKTGKAIGDLFGKILRRVARIRCELRVHVDGSKFNGQSHQKA